MNPKKKRIFDILQIGVKNDKASRIFDYVLVVVIVTNIAVMVLDPCHQTHVPHPHPDTCARASSS